MSSLALLLVAGCSVSADTERYEQAAENAALAWLAHIDTGDYGTSGETAALGFRASITKEQWADRARAVQGELGVPMSRELIARKYTNRQLAQIGTRQGERVIAQYRTTYVAAQHIIETIWMKRDGDQWSTAADLVSFQ